MIRKLFFVVLVLYCTEINADIEERLKQDFFTIYTHAAFGAREITSGNVTCDQITYYLYTRQNQENYTKLNAEDPKQLQNRPKQAKVVFIIHGWTENRERQWYEDLKNGFLQRKEEFYVVQVDWKEPADQLYTVSSYNTKDVGKCIAKFIISASKKYSIPFEDYILVGHSLGGQVSGFIGKEIQNLTRSKLPRIIALDPAGPLFSQRPEEERLNKNDAEVVACLHTDGGTFGFKDACGTIDFYANGGNGQPGCTRIDLLDPSSITDPIMCDHHRSWEFYIEAIFNPDTFVASKCDSWAKFKTFMCTNKNDTDITLGDLQTRERGEYYFDTNKDKPFARKQSDGPVISKIPVVGSTVSKLLKSNN